jgi:hypothetical protein
VDCTTATNDGLRDKTRNSPRYALSLVWLLKFAFELCSFAHLHTRALAKFVRSFTRVRQGRELLELCGPVWGTTSPRGLHRLFGRDKRGVFPRAYTSTGWAVLERT